MRPVRGCVAGGARAAHRGLPGRGRRGGPSGAPARARGAGRELRRGKASDQTPTSTSAGSRQMRHAARAAVPRSGRAGGQPQTDTGATCSSASWRCKTTSSAATTCWPPSRAWVADKARSLAQILVDRGALDDSRRACCSTHWWPSTSSSTAATPRRASRRSARWARCATTWSGLATPTFKPASPRPSSAAGDAAATATYAPSSPPRRRAVPHPPLPPRRWPWPRLRRPRRGARPRGRAQGDPARQGRRGRPPRPVRSGGGDQRRARAPRDRAGLQPGHLR